MELSDLKRVHRWLMHDTAKPVVQQPEFSLPYRGEVVSKERPRKSAGGHVYTPAKTRKYESLICDMARVQMRKLQIPPFHGSLSVHLTIFVKYPKYDEVEFALMNKRMWFPPQRGDMDNKEKAILDALNNVVYLDDRQVVQSYKLIQMADFEGFDIRISPVGLSKYDLHNIKALHRTANA